MNKLVILFLVTLILLLVVLIYPKEIGGPLCGPVCPSLGLHYWEKDCIGFKKGYSCEMSPLDFLASIFGAEPMCTDTFSNYCFGLISSEKRCYGVPYTDFDIQSPATRQLSCNYPCDDSAIMSWCENGTPEEIGTLINCDFLAVKCDWGFVNVDY